MSLKVPTEAFGGSWECSLEGLKSVLGLLGSLWGHLGTSWGNLGRIVGTSWATLGLSSAMSLTLKKRFARVLLVLQPLPSIWCYVVTILGLLSSFGPVLAIFAWAASVMYAHASSLFLPSWAMWSLSSAFLTRPSGMREAIE